MATKESKPGLQTDDRVGMTIGVSVMMTAIVTCLILARLYVRKFVTNALGADDYVGVAALFFIIITTVCINVMTKFGLGRHTWTVEVEEVLLSYLQTFYLLILFYYVALGFIKLTILLQYYRIFSRYMQKWAIIAMVIVSMWSTAIVIVCIFTCKPIHAFWDKSVKGECIPNLPQWYINAAGNIATDLVIFALPVPVLWKLQLPKSQRLSLVAVFGLAFFTCTISLIRLAFLNLDSDPFYDNVAAALWSLAELCCGLIASCLPSLRPILWRLVPSTLRTSGAASGKAAGGTGGGYWRTRSEGRELKGSVARRYSSVEELTDDGFELAPSPTRDNECEGDWPLPKAVTRRDQHHGTSTTVRAQTERATTSWYEPELGIKVKTDISVISSEKC